MLAKNHFHVFQNVKYLPRLKTAWGFNSILNPNGITTCMVISSQDWPFLQLFAYVATPFKMYYESVLILRGKLYLRMFFKYDAILMSRWCIAIESIFSKNILFMPLVLALHFSVTLGYSKLENIWSMYWCNVFPYPKI